MDFAALLSAAANNAKDAGQAVAKLDSKVEAEKKSFLETQRKERQREKAVGKKLSLPPPSFKIPLVKKEQPKEVKKITTPSAKAPKPQPKPTESQKKAQIQPKSQKKPIKPQVPQRKENKPESRKRPPMDFNNLMKMATDISQGKKVEEPKELPKNTPKMTETKKPLVPTARINQRPSPPRIQSSISSFMKKKPEKKVERKATVTQRKEAVEMRSHKSSGEWMRSGYNDSYSRKERYEEEEDDDMSDFIDDDEVDEFSQQEMNEALRAVNRKYDTDKWRQREITISDRHMAADYRTIAREEAESARIGKIEDAIEMKRRGTRAV